MHERESIGRRMAALWLVVALVSACGATSSGGSTTSTANDEGGGGGGSGSHVDLSAGACHADSDCAATATCKEGVCVCTACSPETLAEVNQPTGVGLSGDSVVFIDYEGVHRVPKAGGDVGDLADSHGDSHSFSVGSSFIGWALDDGLRSAPAAGGAAVPLAPDATAVVASGSDLYYGSSDGTLHRVAAAGGTATTVGTGLGVVSGLVIDGSDLYLTDVDGGRVLRMPLSGGSPVVLATGQVNPHGIAVDDTSVYWTNAGDGSGDEPTGTVMRIPKAGGDVATLAKDQASPAGIVTDASYVYWVDVDGLAVYRLPKSAGARPELINGGEGEGPIGIAVDDEAVYWVDYDTNEVVRLAK